MLVSLHHKIEKQNKWIKTISFAIHITSMSTWHWNLVLKKIDKTNINISTIGTNTCKAFS